MDTDDSNKSEAEMKSKEYLTDLTVGFVKHLDDENLAFLYEVIKPQLKVKFLRKKKALWSKW